MLWIETGLVLLSLVVALTFPTFASCWFEHLEYRFAPLTRRHALSVIIVGVSALGLRASLLPIEPIPQPFMNDEFSYLLMSDTFAHGRLTNPTHPMWEHFETFHVNQKPTYCSMYYPGQGLFLAVGQVIFGHPFWGVWLSSGLMCAAFCWALQGWIPSSWAFLGSILAVIRLGAFSYWVNSYWGGTVAAIGGALVLGAFPRIKRYQRIRDSLTLAAGLTVLGNTRPYESIFYSTPILLALAAFFFRSKLPRGSLLRGILLPFSALLVISMSAMCYYFWKTTGSPFRTPYLVNMRTYQAAPNFSWQATRAFPSYRHAVMETFYEGWPIRQYQNARDSPVTSLFGKFLAGWLFFVGPALWLPWLVLLPILPYGMSFRSLGQKTGMLVKICAVTGIGLCLPTWFEPHYAAPACCAFYALELQTMRRIRLWDLKEKQRGQALIRYLVASCILLFVVRVSVGFLHRPLGTEFAATWSGPRSENLVRAKILDSLVHRPGKHLIVTRYVPKHDPRIEWVYNGADIDGSKVVWARDMSSEKNFELIHYFRERTVWLLEPDLSPPKLSLYDAMGGDPSMANTFRKIETR